MQKLPPLDRLRATEAAARLKSFKHAATEIGITPSAVSHRIRLLEAELGTPLFTRHGSGVLPTSAGEQLSASINKAFSGIENTWNALTLEAHSRPIKVACAQALSSHFLIPNLAQHASKHPDFNIEIITTNELSSVENGRADICIHIGTEPKTHLDVEKLTPLDFLLVAGKDHIRKHMKDNVLHGPLLAVKAQANMWELFTEFSDYTIAEDANILWFDAFPNILTAAQNGLGATLIPKWLLPEVANSHKIAAVTEKSLDANMYYWLVSRTRENSNNILSVKNWIKDNIVNKLSA